MAIPILILADPRNWSMQPAAAVGPGGYRPSGTHRTLSAGLAFGAALLVGAGLVTALVAPEVIRERFPGTTVFNVPVPPPPPTPPHERESPLPPINRQLTVPPPLVDTPPTGTNPPIDTGPIITDPYVPVDTGTGGGTAEIVPPEPEFRQAVRDTRFLGRFQPSYPAAREREQVEGRCSVSVTINPAGRVSAVRAVDCPDDLFFRATERQALREWRFRPATRGDRAVETTLIQTVQFRITQ